MYKPEKSQSLQGIEALQDIYEKLTKQFLFNEYVIKDDFDVFVAFETMNNRGKSLSNLELLKNRLIYLTTLYSDIELDSASKKSYRDAINDAWKEIYRQLGRNKTNPLNDDDFLRAHWIMTFPYSRKDGQDYIRFLLDKKFTPQNVHKKVEHVVLLETQQEIRSEQGIEEVEDENADVDTIPQPLAELQPKEILDYVNSLKVSSVHWFNSFFPELASDITSDEMLCLDRLNRVGIAYFRPLVMAILKNESGENERIRIFKEIERFIFVMFRMNSEKSNYGSSEFHRAARRINCDQIPVNDIITELQSRFASTLNNDNNTFRTDDFHNSLSKKFKDGSGYYGWSGIRYFLYEYEIEQSGGMHPKVTWKDFLKSEKDKISIEHIYPQTSTEDWDEAFSDVNQEQRQFYQATLGNLLLLSMSINSSFQNNNFNDKKQVKKDSNGDMVRNGYSNGSHSEIEVSQNPKWGSDEIKSRGIRLLKFMEKRWDIRFESDEARERLLFLNFGR
ncbi:MAG: HNH endonuclease family protein [Cyanobacteria bacterium]|nr:HNH endonuclease family protein [Cyanobacteriota bacterium]